MSAVPPPPAATGIAPVPPVLVPGADLLGPYQGSGTREARYLLRRPDGDLLQVPALVYVVAALANGRRDHEAIAAAASRTLERTVTPANVGYLIDNKLGPAGLIDGVAATDQHKPRAPALLGLGLRTRVLPERLVALASRVLRPLFLPPVVLVVLAGLAALDAWLITSRGVSEAVAAVTAAPAVLLVVAGLTIAGGAFHELGHATACRYGGAKPGVIGVGIYLLWPAFFNDLTDSYRLNRRGRLRADLGGIYFNGVFVLVLAAAHAVSGFEPLLIAIVVQHVVAFHQLLPFLRLDGYYLVCDLAGVPDLQARIRPVLASLLPGRSASAALGDLKPAVRKVVAAWIALTVPAVAGALALLVVRAPRLIAASRAAFDLQAEALARAWGAGQPLGVAASVLHLCVLALPLVGLAFTATRLAARAAGRRRSRSQAPSPSRA